MELNMLMTFDSTHHALRAEQILKENQHRHLLIPTPREITASCGLAIRVDPTNRAAIRQQLEQHGVEVSGLYQWSGMAWERRQTNH